MADLNKLREIAEYCGLSNLVFELEAIDMRSKQENASLILPLVGEFSSGKTTLINALTDSKKLETATKPTTATIYEVHFGTETTSNVELSYESLVIVALCIPYYSINIVSWACIVVCISLSSNYLCRADILACKDILNLVLC